MVIVDLLLKYNGKYLTTYKKERTLNTQYKN